MKAPSHYDGKLSVASLVFPPSFSSLFLFSLSLYSSPSLPSGDGSSASQQSEEPRSPQAMAQAVRVHDDINKVMYFA